MADVGGRTSRVFSVNFCPFCVSLFAGWLFVHVMTSFMHGGTRKLRRFHLMNQVKFGVAVGTGVTFVAAAITVPIVIAAVAA